VNPGWSSWGGDPFAAAGLLLLAWCYARGTVAIWRQVGRGRVVAGRQAGAFAGGIVVALVALASPLDAVVGVSFSAHMLQHTLLGVVAAPLLVLGAPALPLLQGVPHRWRRQAARLHARAAGLRQATGSAAFALAAVASYAAVLWLWHLPVAYEAALRSDLLHAAEHTTVLGAGMLLWWVVVSSGRRSTFGYGLGIMVVFAAALLHGGLGALLTFAPAALYPTYAAQGAALGFDAHGDQLLAGVLMWGPAKLVHALAVVALVVGWLSSVERRTERQEGRSRGVMG
jgi:putative membrane protein